MAHEKLLIWLGWKRRMVTARGLKKILQNIRVLLNITEVGLQGRKKQPWVFHLLIRRITTLTSHVLR
jgi:hypothetical protein